MWTQKFWRQSIERAAKTAAQFALVGMGVSWTGDMPMDPQRFSGIDWPMIGDFALYGAAISILFSVVSAAFNDSDTPSLVKQ